ncbi:MAG TPA: hypothetical protein VL147_01620 [Devosia sp.]|nr:hypothetical protein [Devosia sp.]
MMVTKLPVYAIDRFDLAYSILHVALMAMEADGMGSDELTLIQMRETMRHALDMMVPVRTAMDKAGLELPEEGEAQ